MGCIANYSISCEDYLSVPSQMAELLLREMFILGSCLEGTSPVQVLEHYFWYFWRVPSEFYFSRH